MRNSIVLVTLLTVICSAGGILGDEVSFNRDIRPILSDRCYFCHGFDENHREADLRLDDRGQAEYVWDVDAPDESEIMLRITSDDPDYVMPPPGAHKQAIAWFEVRPDSRPYQVAAPRLVGLAGRASDDRTNGRVPCGGE